MNLRELCNAANIECGYCDIDIKNVKSNSGQIEKGDLFVCVEGLNTDGHRYVKAAEKRGAAAIIAQRETESRLPTVYAPNTKKALERLCDAVNGFPSKKLKLVAVTGTNGKTTVTHLLRNIFEASMYKTGLIGTVGAYSQDRKIEIVGKDPLANMTTPDPEELYFILGEMAKDGVEFVFMEASSHALAQNKLDGLRFEAAVFTNLTPEHLDFHGTMEDYYAAKASLFKMAEHKIVNADDEYGKRLAREYPDVVKCSLKRKCCDFFADDVVDKGMDGSEYRLVSRNRHFKVRSHLVGDFNIMNTLQAAACASLLGVSPSGISGAISSLRGVVGRLERVKLDAITDFKIFIDYAHTPDALENLLLTVSRSKECGERIVLLFGCGGDRDKSKRKRMGEIAREYADKIIVTSDNSRSEDPENIIAQILEGIGADEHTVIVNRAEAIDHAVKTAQKGDVILLVGKGHELYEIDKDGRRYFDERKIAAEAARKYFY